MKMGCVGKIEPIDLRGYEPTSIQYYGATYYAHRRQSKLSIINKVRFDVIRSYRA